MPAFEDLFTKLEQRLSQGQSDLVHRLNSELTDISRGQTELEQRGQAELSQETAFVLHTLVRDTTVALKRLWDTQEDVSFNQVSQTAEVSEMVRRLSYLEKSVQMNRQNKSSVSPDPCSWEIVHGIVTSQATALSQPATSLTLETRHFHL